MINLQRINQDLLFKLEKLNYNTNSASKAESLTGNRKRRSLSNTPSSSLHMTLFSTRAPDSASNTPNFGQSFSKKNAFSDQFGNRSYFDAEFDDIEENNDTDMFRVRVKKRLHCKNIDLATVLNCTMSSYGSECVRVSARTVTVTGAYPYRQRTATVSFSTTPYHGTVAVRYCCYTARSKSQQFYGIFKEQTLKF